MTQAFAELVAATNYSFLHGASHPREMIVEAIAMGMTGIGIADRNTVAGVVRAYVALRDMKEAFGDEISEFKLVVGARLVFADGTPDIVAYPINRRGWGRLTRLLTEGNLQAKKGECKINLIDLLRHQSDMILIVMDGDEDLLRILKRANPGKIWLAASKYYAGADSRYLMRLRRMSVKTGVPLVATNDALYATASQRPLHDVVTCIREGLTIQEAGKLLAANGERCLKGPDEIARLFRSCPKALKASQDILALIDFTLDDLRYEYPHEPVPKGWDPQDWLEHLVMEAAHEKNPEGLSEDLVAKLKEEFTLIRKRRYAYYFLTVHDVVKYARSLDPPILCQGRGSAANSVVCYLLGITSVDPVANRLLFSRFLSDKRNEPPDIDVDFEHERREEVIQYIYDRYGERRAAIAATVIHYRQKSTFREVGKALGIADDVTARLAKTVWGNWGESEVSAARINEAGLDIENPEITRFKEVADQLLEFPRHLSQHVGGFVLTQGRLDELVPIHNAAMPKRRFVEWDKNDIDALGIMKVDVLALGMLTCIRKSFDLMRLHEIADHNLASVPSEDSAVYDMLCEGDSIGTFQVESRAQISMLPRLRPRELYDLVIQVAIVRPGPIQGGMVHPYLRRRNKEEMPEYPAPSISGKETELYDLLGKTLGVPLFQEQAMKLAITAAGFSPTEADGLRRAMATFRRSGEMPKYQSKMIEGMVARGYEREFAERCFNQIKGFGEYGFPESHAQSFAFIAYISSWLKCHHPAIFTCGLLNSQPMGFYAPSQLIRDAQKHGVEVRAIDVNASFWNNSIERIGEGEFALRLGFRQIDGFRKDWEPAIVSGRETRDYRTIEDFATRVNIPKEALNILASADAYGSLEKSRRNSLWDVRRVSGLQLSLFASASQSELADEIDAALPTMPLSEEVVADYQTTRLSLKGHPMQFLREHFRQEGAISCKEVNEGRNSKLIRTAGVVITRQRPGKGNAIFITLEDETGIVNVLLWARQLERQRRAVMASRLMIVDGEIQRSKEGVVHLIASRITDATYALDLLSEDQRVHVELLRSDIVTRPQYPRGHGHPRNVRILPPSRDFH